MIGDNQVTPAKLETISGLAAGTYGTATAIPAITIDTKGRVTAVTTNPASVTAPRIRAVKFAEINGGNASTVVAFTWTSLLDSQGNLRAAGTGLTGRFGTGFDLANSVGGGFFTSQIPFTDANEAIAKYFVFPNGMIVLSTTGNLYSTGENTYGALGLGDTTNRSVFNKIAISNVAQLSVSQEGNDTSAVHCFAVTTSGALYAWGYNAYGQLGDGTTTNRTAPVLISGGALAGKTITKCFAFGVVGFSFVIDSDRKLYATGYNGQGQLGLGDTTNRSSFTQVSLVEADTVCGAGGASATYAAGTSWIVWDGEVYGSGYNLNGEIGDGTILSKTSFTKALGSLTGVQSLSVSNNYPNDGASVAALKTDGTVRVWGRNTAAGQLGIGTTVNQTTPTTLAGGFAATQFSKIIMAGYVANCRFYALRTNGLLYSCGAASSASGDGVSSIRTVLNPVRQYNGLTFTDFRIYGDTGTQHSVLAITPNGELWNWGYNNAVQLGVGTSTTTISTPQRVSLG
jgi:alpha-tubulin suppressor-like RCC1 family protein